MTNAPFKTKTTTTTTTTTLTTTTTTTPFDHEDVVFDGIAYYHLNSDVYQLEGLSKYVGLDREIWGILKRHLN